METLKMKRSNLQLHLISTTLLENLIIITLVFLLGLFLLVSMNCLNVLFVLILCTHPFIRPYDGVTTADDPQRRLNISNPRLPGGELPPGFLGFAVNMVNIDSANLYCATKAGQNLRETLFYNLFSLLQVYRTREDMLRALPCIKHGAISMDGGMIKHNGVFALGKREVEVKFPIGRSNIPENYFDTGRQIKEMKWKKDRFVEDMQREQALLDHARLNFDIRKQEYLKFLARPQSYTTQQIKPERTA